MTKAEYAEAMRPVGWAGKRVVVAEGTDFGGDDDDGPAAKTPDQLSGPGVVTAEIPCPGGAVLNVLLDTGVPVTALSENVAVEMSE